MKKCDRYYSYLIGEFRDSSIIRFYQVNKQYEEIEVVRDGKYLIFQGAEKIYLSYLGRELLTKCEKPISEKKLIEQMKTQFSEYDSETILCHTYMLIAKLKREKFLRCLDEDMA